jgi:hypothetical protein
MNYNTNYICKYNNNIFSKEEEETLSENEKYFINDSLYRNDILNIFNLEEFDETEINNCINKIYEKIKNYDDLKPVLKKLAAFFFSEDCELGILLMFSYDYLEHTHPCMCEFLETGKISVDKLDKLKDVINKNI